MQRQHEEDMDRQREDIRKHTEELAAHKAELAKRELVSVDKKVVLSVVVVGKRVVGVLKKSQAIVIGVSDQ